MHNTSDMLMTEVAYELRNRLCINFDSLLFIFFMMIATKVQINFELQPIFHIFACSIFNFQLSIFNS